MIRKPSNHNDITGPKENENTPPSLQIEALQIPVSPHLSPHNPVPACHILAQINRSWDHLPNPLRAAIAAMIAANEATISSSKSPTTIDV